ncbi:DUF1919 domain-containing protein [Acutalibacter sp. 1XD8-33]|nr:DUF1919 domain-containing protein [Acutalibacter sp. 1XD8-33]
MKISVLAKFQTLLAIGPRAGYALWRRFRLRGAVPTTISRDCTGGILCHDLRLAVLSPTVNLWNVRGGFHPLLPASSPVSGSGCPGEIPWKGIPYRPADNRVWNRHLVFRPLPQL